MARRAMVAILPGRLCVSLLSVALALSQSVAAQDLPHLSSANGLAPGAEPLIQQAAKGQIFYGRLRPMTRDKSRIGVSREPFGAESHTTV